MTTKAGLVDRRIINGETIARRARVVVCIGVLIIARAAIAGAHPDTATIAIRGHAQTVRLYGPPDGPPAIVSSGDGGWIHLGPRVAEILAARGYFVVGFDTRAYLMSFTAHTATLSIDEVPGDYAALLDFVCAHGRTKPLLVGVSEGAGLSVLAAANPAIKSRVSGVIALGLGDRNELGWRWRDSIIYLTHAAPDEPWFSALDTIARVAPLPVAMLNATHDEFVPAAEAQRVMNRAGEPKRLWMIAAADHRFSDAQAELELRLIDAVTWISATVSVR